MASGNFKRVTGRFGSSTDEEIKQLIEEHNRPNTNKSTNQCVGIFRQYLQAKNFTDLELITDAELPNILKKFYADARKSDGSRYHTQSLKNIRSGINRYMKETRKLDIIDGTNFQEANMAFQGAQVKAKKEGRGVRRSTPVISDNDMQQLAVYFNIDHIKTPNLTVLQKNVIFNILYYLCRRGQENLYEMTKDWFKLITTYEGDRFIAQVRDELDKNHSENDYKPTNEGRMYAVEGK